jgi:Zn finger protein HypA/HybF involved in hydrogenase expression
MHELGIVTQLVQKVKEEAEKRGAKKVRSILLRLCDPSFDKESIKTHFLSLSSTEPLLSQTSLILEEGEGEGIILEKIEIETD